MIALIAYPRCKNPLNSRVTFNKENKEVNTIEPSKTKGAKQRKAYRFLHRGKHARKLDIAHLDRRSFTTHDLLHFLMKDINSLTYWIISNVTMCFRV